MDEQCVYRALKIPQSLWIYGLRVLTKLYSIAKNVGFDVTALQLWIALLEENAILRVVSPYFNNLNQRLIKTPKLYFKDVTLDFEDVAVAVLQRWMQAEPLIVSLYFGGLLENLTLTEITRFFTNRCQTPQIYFIRSKDFLIHLPKNRYIAIEVKATPMDMSTYQL